MFSFAAKNGLVPEGMNPAKGVERFPQAGRERLLSAGEVLVRSGHGLEAGGDCGDTVGDGPR